MLRGAIESVSRNRTYGWIWSPDASLRGRTVLAFLDEACIGGGKIDGFRKDLKDAGLGDGYAGFNFDLTYPNPADAPRVTVKLEGSDFVLVQAGSRLGLPQGEAGAAWPTELSTLRWMCTRGWLSQSDFDFLRFLRQLGVYERSLVVPPAGEVVQERAPQVILDPAETAASMLALTRFDEVVVKREALASLRDWRRLAEQQHPKGGPGAVFGLWAPKRARLAVIEGSHTSPPEPVEQTRLPTGTEYGLGPDRLLFLDARIVLGATAAFPAGGLEVFYRET